MLIRPIIDCLHVEKLLCSIAMATTLKKQQCRVSSKSFYAPLPWQPLLKGNNESNVVIHWFVTHVFISELLSLGLI